MRADPRGDGRERPWRRAAANVRIDVARKGAEANPAGLAAAELLVSNSIDLDRQRLLDSLRADARRPRGQGRGSHYSRDTLLLAPDEVRELAAAVEAVLAPYRRVNRTAPPPDATSYAAALIVAQEKP